MSVGVIVFCMPTVPHLWRHFISRRGGATTGGTTRRPFAAGSGGYSDGSGGSKTSDGRGRMPTSTVVPRDDASSSDNLERGGHDARDPGFREVEGYNRDIEMHEFNK